MIDYWQPLERLNGNPVNIDAELQQQLCGRLLHVALAVPGAMHLMHNMTREMNVNLGYWDEFWIQLKIIEQIIAPRSRRERFVASCISGGEHARLGISL